MHKISTLITGGAGHLGNALVRELLDQGEKVRVLILPGEKTVSLEGLDVEKVEGNILDLESLKRAMDGIRRVFHMAGLVGIIKDQTDLMRRVNIGGTENVIQVAREAGVERMIYTSTVHALKASDDGGPTDESLGFNTENPHGDYDSTKAEASVLVQQAVKDGMDAVITCPTGVIGPYDFNRSELGGFILSWMKKTLPLSIEGQYDFVDVRDVAIGHRLAAEKGRKGEAYLLTGHQITITHFRELVHEAAGFRLPLVTVPNWLTRAAVPLAEAYYRITKTRPRFTSYALYTLQGNSVFSSRKALMELGYSPRPIEETMRDTVAWWRKNSLRTEEGLRTDGLKGK